MVNFYLPTSQRTRESIKKDPIKFIEDLTDQIKALGYCKEFHYTVRMSPYPNPIRRFLNYIVSFFTQSIKTIDLYDLDKVREYHSKNHPLEFKSKTPLSIHESAISLGFNNNDNSYLIDVFSDEIEITAFQHERENEELVTCECERILYDVFGRVL